MKTGLYISGIGHGGLILWILVGGIFSAPDPEPFEVTEVSIMTGAEFAALSAPAAAPSTQDEVSAPQAPEVSAPTTPPAPESVPRPPARPEAAEEATPDAAPDVTGLEPLPEAEVADEPPVLVAPAPLESPETVVSNNTAPREAPRVAPTPVAPPPPDAAVSETVQIATKPAEPTPVPAEKVEETTAPEEASSQIVTEADKPSDSNEPMASSPRPKPRPNRPAPKPDAPADPAPEPAATAAASAIANAIANRPATPEQPVSGNGTAPSGPPLSRGEQDAFRVAVQQCWNIDPGSPAARVVVTVGMEMLENGRVESSSLKLLSSSGGDDIAVRSAFDSARRAILRCGAEGYNLPPEKYDHWRTIEITFDPSKMRN